MTYNSQFLFPIDMLFSGLLCKDKHFTGDQLMLEPQPPLQRAQGTWSLTPANLTGLVCINFWFALSASHHCLTLL